EAAERERVARGEVEEAVADVAVAWVEVAEAKARETALTEALREEGSAREREAAMKEEGRERERVLREEGREREAALMGEVAAVEDQVSLLDREAQLLRDKVEGMQSDKVGMLAERRRLQACPPPTPAALQELRGNIRVICRIKPAADPAQPPILTMRGPVKPLGFGLEITDPSQTREVVRGTPTPMRVGGLREAARFVFDHVLEPQTSQAEVFDEVAEMVESVLDGYKVCIFAYGQTGSGKTYTMQGHSAEGGDVGADAKEAGLIPRAVEKVFSEAKERAADGWTHCIQVSFVEIYREQFRDLLDNRYGLEKQMEITRDEAGNPHVSNLISMEVPNP
ncbi:P-loop containing nucleoside triphosphate hydrolase protein, partial [Baffinella frigidus]